MAQGQNSSLEGLLSQYSTGTKGLDPLRRTTEAEAGRLRSAGTPSFEDMFSRYLTVSNREADRQAAEINESFGARGARYGSDLLRAQGDLRQRISQDQAMFANKAQLDLESSRQNLLGQVLQSQYGIGTSEFTGREAAMNRLYGDFLRRTQAPPLLGAGASFYGNYGPGTTAVY